MENNPNYNTEEKRKNVPKEIRKRIKKSESGKRNFICKMCEKSYLTHSALYIHCLKKHNIKIKTQNPKGRPKTEKDKNPYDPKKPCFFKHEKRTGKTSKENINECSKRAFIFIYQQNQKNANNINMKVYNNIEEHPFLSKFINDKHSEKIIDTKEKIDKVLMCYLNQMSNICNQNYFEKLIIFITLFREYVNIFHKKSDYTTVNDAKEIPELSNGFINNFLYPDENETNFGLEKQEVIDLITNLCSWLYTNDFTDYKLFLKGEEESEEEGEEEKKDILI